MKRPEIVSQISKVMHQQHPDVQVILYGSEARGDARPDSDIDLLVLVDKDNINLDEQLAIGRPLYDIELDTGVIISSFFDTVKNWNSRVTEFTENVNREGIRL